MSPIAATALSVQRIMVARGDARLEVLVQGKGPTIVMLPSLGRGASDFDAIADQLADAGFRVLRPEPRGIGLISSTTSPNWPWPPDCFLWRPRWVADLRMVS